MALTDTTLRELHRRAKKGEKVPMKSDGGGLNFQDGKYWRFTYYFAGKKKRLAFGVYPDVSLKAARQAREKARELLAQGIDPAEKKKAERAEAERIEHEQARTFRVVALEYYERKLTDRRDLYKRQTLARFENQIFPFLGDVPISKLRPSDILAGLRRVEERGSLDMAHRLASLIRQVCRYAVASGYSEFNAAAELSAAMTPKPKAVPRAAILDPHRIGQLLRDIDEYQGSFSVKYALKLMPYLFVRSQELRNARWDEIDFDKAVWNIPAERMKMKSPHTVPLARQVVKLLTELHEWTGHTGLLFPSAQSNTRSITDVGLLNALRRMGYGRDEMCIHGFRSIASTHLNESGKWRSDVIESALAHAERNQVRAAYNRAEYLPERTAMMQEWADWLDRLRAGQ